MDLKKKVFLLVKYVFVLSIFALTIGCTTGDNLDLTDKYTVIYDGNGGFLGNKTYTFRKLEVDKNSKIPKYLSEYTQDPYVVSSLGLATREGYRLIGWYLEENATYVESLTGDFIYFDNNDGNGIYTVNDEGDYVYGYVQDEEGKLIFITVESLTDEDDPETTEFVFLEAGDGYGFYKYDSEDSEHVEAYTNLGSFLQSDLTAYGKNYLVFDDLSETEKTLFALVPKYVQAFYEYTEVDEGLTRYSLSSGYMNISTVFETNENGNYVFTDDHYVKFDSTNPDHDTLDRFSLSNRVVFVETDTVDSPTDLKRYNATIVYWDFENDRVTEDLTLLAHWEQKLTVNYVQKSGQITVITTKQNDDNTGQVNLVAGETIGQLESIPKLTGYTFVGWSTSETEYLPWNFDQDVFPEDTTELYLYAYMIEGEYTRIVSATGLAKVADDLDGKYLLINDIDLNGTEYRNSSPLGFELKTSVGTLPIPFTGEFISMGATIKNFTLYVTNTQKLINKDAGVVVVSALFPYVQNAIISGFNVEDAQARLETSSSITGIVCDLGASVIVGTALEGNTTISNVTVEMTFNVTTDNVIDYSIYVGDIVARGSEYTTITNANATVDYTALVGKTTDELVIQTLD